jgi:chromosome segregation ATPase
LQESKGESETFKAARIILVKEIDSLKEAVKAASGEQAKAERAVQDLERKHAEAVSTRDSLANEKATLAGEISVLQANLDAAKSFAFPGSPTSQHLLVAPGTPGATGGSGDVPGALNESSIIMSSPMNKSREQEIVEFERERAEHEQIVGNLIETKMALAINNSELDEEKLKVVALQKRLQAYTSKISSLEERLVENMEKQKSSRGVFLFRRKQQQHDAKAVQQKQQRGGRVFEDDDDDL